MKGVYFVCYLLIICFHAQAQASSAERVTAKGTFYYNGAIYVPDAFYSYYWSGGRSSGQDGVKVLLENYDSMDRHPYNREIRTYDPDGNTTRSVNRIWDASSLTWRDTRRFTYQYLDKKLIRVTEEESLDGVLSNVRQTSYIFSGSGLIEKFDEVWNGDTWIGSRQIRYKYTAGNLSEETEGNWKNKIRVQYFRGADCCGKQHV